MKFKFVPKDKPRREFNQSKNLMYASYLLVTSLTLLAWNETAKGSLSGFSLPSLLAMLAFGFMWVHYLATFLKTNYEPELNTSTSTKLTQCFVLIAIIAHPVAIITYLNDKGYGLPPASFESYFGANKALFISLGTISLIAFLAFEFKKYLKNRPRVWSGVLKFNDLAMLLIILHGFKLGFVINSTWFKYVWLGYGLSLLYFFYDKYILKRGIKRYAEVFIIGLVILMMVFIGLAVPGDSDSKTPTKTSGSSSQSTSTSSTSVVVISSAELAKNNGLNGQKCWIAVNGEVYDSSNNPEWKNGQHTPSRGLAKCGEDLSEVIKQSPHGTSVLQELPVIGKLTS